jgi:hypothetical protein
MSSADDFSRFLEGVFDLAGREKSSCGGIVVLVFAVFMVQSEFMVVIYGSAERANWTVVWLEDIYNSTEKTYSCSAILTSLIHCTPESLKTSSRLGFAPTATRLSCSCWWKRKGSATVMYEG